MNFARVAAAMAMLSSVTAGAQATLVSGPTYTTVECSSSNKTGRVRGEIHAVCDSGVSCVDDFRVTIPRCDANYAWENAEIYLRGWKRHHTETEHEEGLLEIGTTKAAFDAQAGRLAWRLHLRAETGVPEKTEYLVKFEILLTRAPGGTDPYGSYVARLTHGCSSGTSDTCSQTTTSSWPNSTVAARGLALSRFRISTAGSVPIMPTAFKTDVSTFSVDYSTLTLSSTMDCRFGQATPIGVECETESVVVGISDTEGESDHRVLTVSGALVSTEASADNHDNKYPQFRLCGLEKSLLLSLENQSPFPEAPNKVWGLWSGADETDPLCGSKLIALGRFEGTWLYFWGAEHQHSSKMFLDGVPMDSASQFKFDSETTILSPLVW